MFITIRNKEDLVEVEVLPTNHIRVLLQDRSSYPYQSWEIVASQKEYPNIARMLHTIDELIAGLKEGALENRKQNV